MRSFCEILNKMSQKGGGDFQIGLTRNIFSATPNFRRFNCQLKDVLTKKSNRMTYNPCIENAVHKQSNADSWRYIHSHCPSLSQEELNRLSRELSSFTAVYNLFLGNTVQVRALVDDSRLKICRFACTFDIAISISAW